MRCEQVVIELDGYVKGELGWGTTEQIEQHLKQCPACAAELLMLDRENAVYAAYSLRVQQPEDAWNKVQMRITHLGTHARQMPEPQVRGSKILRRLKFGAWWTWAAAACLLVAVGLSLYYYKHASRAPRAVEITDGAPEVKPELDRAVTDLDHAVALLNLAYDERKRDLDPSIIAELDRNLKVIDAAIAECQQALQVNPDDLQAAEFLLIAYEKRIDVLKQVTEE